MADIKISQLGAAVAVSGTDVLPMVNSSNPATTNKVTAATLKEYVIGDTDISAIGDGTPTGAISALKSGKVEGTAISENIETIGSTAIGDYVSGNTFLASNGNYYEATASITGGTTTLTVGTNCKLSTVDEQIGSLKEALTNEVSARATNGAHNLLPLTASTQAVKGVTFTITDTISISGVPSTSYVSLIVSETNNVDGIRGQYVKVSMNGKISGSIYCLIECYDSSNVGTDIGIRDNLETPVLIPSSTVKIKFRIYVFNTFSGTATLLNPMIRLASDADPTYQPYAKTNKELTTDQTKIENKTVTYNGLTFQFSKRNGVVTMLIGAGSATNALAINDVLVEVPNGFKPSLEVQGIFTAGASGRFYYIDTAGAFKPGVAASAGATLRGTITYVSAQ